MFQIKGLLAFLSIILLLVVTAFPAALATGSMQAPPTEVNIGKPSGTPKKKIPLFGRREIRSRNVKSFNKWSEMWRRHNLPVATENQKTTRAQVKPRNCNAATRLECSREDWNRFIEEQKGAPFVELIKNVNHYMNRTTYIVDPVNWGIPDYWATPDEFFMRDGDCEDYAISKYITLKRLGVDPADMRLVVLQDENLRAAHAILAVRYQDHYMILDNQVDQVLPDTQILHYRPVYSINESGWWLHPKKRFTSG